jgi:hypothetical protein
MKKTNLYFLFTLVGAALFLVACKKKFEIPAEPSPLVSTGKIKIDAIKNIYAAYYSFSVTPKPTKGYKFTSDVSLYCMVTADESSGNIYKSVFVRDSIGAIKLNFINAGGLAVGDSIQINLNGVVLNDYGKQIQLDSINLEKSVRKISSGNTVIPTKVTLQQLTSNLSKWESRLIRLDSVEFDLGSKGQPYADAINKVSIERNLITTGSPIVVRSSGYANFASVPVPCGKGSIIVVAGQYNGAIQLTIRDVKEVAFAGGNCPLLLKNFSDNITSGGWTTAYPTGTMNPTGNIVWTIGTFGGRSYANITNFVSGNKQCESWLISPSLNLSATNNPILSFITAKNNFAGPLIQALVSTNYVAGSNPNTATWTSLVATLSTGNFTWTNSGNISLNAYKASNVTIGFKYTGTTSSGSNWEIDDIAILDN